MPTVLYKWDFETGDTQGWTLASGASLDSSSAVQGTYSLSMYRSGNPSNGQAILMASISNIDLSSATKPFMILWTRLKVSCPINGMYSGVAIRVAVSDSSGNTLLQLDEKVYYDVSFDITKVLAFDLSSVAGKSGLTISIYIVGADGGVYYQASLTMYVDNIYIIDGGDKEYQVALLGVNGATKTLTYSIPSTDSSLPSGSTTYSIVLASPPNPLTEGTDIFQYTATCDQGSATVDSTSGSNKHASTLTTPSVAPTTFSQLSIYEYPKSAGTTWYYYDKVLVVTFWDNTKSLKTVYVFRLAITINPYSPTYATAFINTTYGSAWSGQKDFQVKIHAHSHSASIFVRFLVGDNTMVQTGSVTLTVYSSDYSTTYGSSSIDLTTGTQLQGATISNLPVDTTVIYRISWSITANSRVVIEVRPQFIVY